MSKKLTSSVAIAEDRRSEALNRAIDAAIEAQRIVGCVVLVAENGRIVFQRAAGDADREARSAMMIETPFRLASVTKLFTTMAALRLAASGRLSPADPVSRYLPQFTLKMANGEAATPTVSHLMAHIAGLDYRFQQVANGSYAQAGISDGLDDDAVSLSENIRRIASVALDHAPGSAWRYSVATDVLGAVIETVTGQTLDQAIAELVTEPLGLDVRFHWRVDELATPYFDAQPSPQRMTGVTDVPLPFVAGPGVSFDPGRIEKKTAWLSGGAGMAGRAHDVLTLLEAFRAGDFLDEDWRAAARAPRIGEEAQAQGPGWGYSWIGAALLDPVSANSRWNPGSVSWGGAYGAWWGIEFARNLSVVALTNTAFEGMVGQFTRDIAAAVVEGPAS